MFEGAAVDASNSSLVLVCVDLRQARAPFAALALTGLDRLEALAPG